MEIQTIETPIWRRNGYINVKESRLQSKENNQRGALHNDKYQFTKETINVYAPNSRATNGMKQKLIKKKKRTATYQNLLNAV